jgi:heme A synthase
MTLLRSIGTVPVFYGVMHQAIAIFIFGITLLIIHLFKTKGINHNGWSNN